MGRCSECLREIRDLEKGRICADCYEEFGRSVIATIRCPRCLVGLLDADLRCQRCRREYLLLEKGVAAPVSPEEPAPFQGHR
jgi:DNA-directed RNA polymerase subunit RPC12/RpoP